MLRESGRKGGWGNLRMDIGKYFECGANGNRGIEGGTREQNILLGRV